MLRIGKSRCSDVSDPNRFLIFPIHTIFKSTNIKCNLIVRDLDRNLTHVCKRFILLNIYIYFFIFPFRIYFWPLISSINQRMWISSENSSSENWNCVKIETLVLFDKRKINQIEWKNFNVSRIYFSSTMLNQLK